MVIQGGIDPGLTEVIDQDFIHCRNYILQEQKIVSMAGYWKDGLATLKTTGASDRDRNRNGSRRLPPSVVAYATKTIVS